MAKTLKLTALPGVGEKLAAQLIGHFGSEEQALRALLEARVEEVAEAVGSRRRALRLIQAARAAEKGYSPGEVFGTQEARKLFENLIGFLASLASSRPARDELLNLAPAPSRAAPRGPLPQCRSAEAGRLGTSALEALRRSLSRIDWPRGLPARLPAEATLYAPPGLVEEARRAAEALGVDAEVEALEPGAEPRRPCASYRLGLEECPAIEDYGRAALAPRSILEAAASAKPLAEALLEASRVAPGLLQEAAGHLGLDAGELVALAKRLLETVEAFEKRRYGGEYERVRRALEQLDAAASDLEVWLNEEARRRLEQREFKLTAAELLRLISSLEEGEVRLPDSIIEVFEELALEAEERLAQRLGLTVEEARLLSGLVEPSPRLPLQLNQERLEELRRSLEARERALRHIAEARLAVEAEQALQRVEDMARLLVWVDEAIACRLYRERLGAGETMILDPSGYLGAGFTRGREVELAAKLGPEKVEPVSYVVGCTPYRPEGTSCEPIAILTGANSGGKTTLLKLIAEAVLAAQAGLPAPAEKAWIAPFDKVYYIAKPTGMLSAGALETVLRQLGEIVEEARRGRRILLLIDEFEAVTEAHAAARIVAVLVRQLLDSGNAAAVIVSHMADEILEALGPLRDKVRIDGIEAEGLDENYNLIVRRSPRYRYHARSTPELVVRRLVHLESRRGQAAAKFYQELMRSLSGL